MQGVWLNPETMRAVPHSNAAKHFFLCLRPYTELSKTPQNFISMLLDDVYYVEIPKIVSRLLRKSYRYIALFSPLFTVFLWLCTNSTYNIAKIV